MPEYITHVEVCLKQTRLLLYGAEVTLTLTANSGDGMRIELDHTYHTSPGVMERDIQSMLTDGAAELLRKYEAWKAGQP